MKYETLLPNYGRSILNIPNSFLKHYGIKPYHNDIPELSNILNKKEYKNIVFIVFDAMSSFALDNNISKDSFLRKHKIMDLTSIFPSTTGSAYTTLVSGLSPVEHGWLGWHCYFKEYGHSIELFKNKDFYTKEFLYPPNIANNILGYEDVNERIKRKSKKPISTYNIIPEFGRGIEVVEEIFLNIKDLCRLPEKKHIFAYWDNPDSIMHKTGCISKEVSEVVTEINNKLEKATNENEDTLFVVTADHGQIDIQDFIFINEIPELQKFIEFPPSFHERAMNFMLKPGTEDFFKEKFIEILSEDDFILVQKNDYIKNFLGPGIPHKKINDFVGNYVAISIGNKVPIYKNSENDLIKLKKAYHAGLTKQEMLVPLIVC